MKNRTLTEVPGYNACRIKKKLLKNIAEKSC